MIIAEAEKRGAKMVTKVPWQFVEHGDDGVDLKATGTIAPPRNYHRVISSRDYDSPWVFAPASERGQPHLVWNVADGTQRKIEPPSTITLLRDTSTHYAISHATT